MPLYRESFVFAILTDEPAIFWTGHGLLPLPDDDVLDVPALASGAGEIINLPDFEALLNGQAQRVDVTLSGVSVEILALAAEEADQIPGAQVHIGRVDFDSEWQVSGPVVWEWTGEGQKMVVARDQGPQRTITLSIAAGDTTRSRAPFSFFTDADQKRDFPTDDFFSHVAGINAGVSRRWGPSG